MKPGFMPGSPNTSPDPPYPCPNKAAPTQQQGPLSRTGGERRTEKGRGGSGRGLKNPGTLMADPRRPREVHLRAPCGLGVAALGNSVDDLEGGDNGLLVLAGSAGRPEGAALRAVGVVRGRLPHDMSYPWSVSLPRVQRMPARHGADDV